MSIKLLAFDLDGTVYYNNSEILESTRKAFDILREKNIILIPVTGRTIDSVEKILESLNFNVSDYLAVLNTGSVIQRLGKRKVLWNRFLTIEDYQLLRRIVPDSLNLTVYSTDHLFFKKITKEFIDDASTLLTPLKEIRTDKDLENICRINIMGDPDLITKFEKDNSNLLKKYYTVRNIPESLEILNINASKGTALDHIMDAYGISKNEVLVIGDGNNDVTMFELTNNSVAMGNASDYVKSKAKHVTQNIEDDGFYNALKEFNLI